MDTFRQTRSCSSLRLSVNKMNRVAEYCPNVLDWMLLYMSTPQLCPVGDRLSCELLAVLPKTFNVLSSLVVSFCTIVWDPEWLNGPKLYRKAKITQKSVTPSAYLWNRNLSFLLLPLIHLLTNPLFYDPLEETKPYVEKQTVSEVVQTSSTFILSHIKCCLHTDALN